MSRHWPPGPVTPYGIDLVTEGVEPIVRFTTGNKQVSFDVNGGGAPHPGVQPGMLLKDGIKGLHPKFSHLDQKGAHQDGVTNRDTVYDEGEFDMTVIAQARDAVTERRLVNDWIEMWDPKKTPTMTFVTPDMGEWWCYPRLHRASPEGLQKLMFRNGNAQFTWSIRNDDAFFQSHPSVSEFYFSYRSQRDAFRRDSPAGLGADWDQKYTTGAGTCGTDGQMCRWFDSGTGERTVVNRYKPGVTATDNQVITIKLGGLAEFPFPDATFNDIWGRMNTTGDPGTTGIRARIGSGWIRLSGWVAGTEVWVWERPLIVAPFWNEEWSLVCGTPTNAREFRVLRNGFPVLKFIEPGTLTSIGAAFRSTGFGMKAGAGISGFNPQVSPAPLWEWSSGDNATVTQSGFLPLTNIGTEDGWPRITAYGPGLFRFGNGPGSTDMIEFGPLLEGQIAQITTLPRLRGVVDLSPDQPEQDLDEYQDIMKRLISLATNGNVPPLLEWFESQFGIRPPQGMLYSYLNGRFNRPWPGKEAGMLPVTGRMAVEIKDGNANSRVIAAITPRRRWPV